MERRKVLIADDEVKVCRLIESLVPWESLGLSVVGMAHDGPSALEMASRLSPDILITDIRMPGLDGIELIGRAKALFPSLRCIIISGYRHFDYAHNAIKYGVEDYLLKPLQKQELIVTLEKLRHMPAGDQAAGSGALTSALFEDCLHGRALPGESFPGRYAIELTGPDPVYALVIKADLQDVGAGEPVRRIAAQKLCEAALEDLTPLSRAIYSGLGPSAAYLLTQPLQAASARLLETLQALRDRAEMMRDLFPTLRVNMGLSGPAQPGALDRAVKEADAALARRLLHPAGAVFVYQPIPPCPATLRDALGSKAQKALSAALQSQCASGYEPLLESAFQSIVNAAGDDLRALHTLLRELIRFHFEQLPLSMPLADMEIMTAAFDELWLTSLSLGEAGRAYVALLGGHLSRMAEESRQQEQRPLRRAKAYIREHYQEPLTLERVSEIAGFHPAYFSTLFKKETGEGFVEYLASVRISAAKQLLTDTDLAIPAIAEQAGYGEPKYFAKQFKKTTGLTPQEYRKLYG